MTTIVSAIFAVAAAIGLAIETRFVVNLDHPNGT
jgi:hypothetical protein